MSFLKTIALASVIGFGAAGAAAAADLPARGPAPAPAPVFVAAGWTGFYAGLNVGYGCCGDDQMGVRGPVTFGNGWFNEGQLAPKGIFGGVQLGYNWQRGNLVYGLEADFQVSGMKRSATSLASVADVGSGVVDIFGNNKVQWFGSVRPRVGFLVSPNTLLYGTGGLGVMNSKYSVFGIDAAGINGLMASNSTKIGWVLGAGIEHKFNANWSAKLEYQYHNYGRKNLDASFLTALGVSTGERGRTNPTPNFHTVRIGLNYHFVTGGGAVVAKY